MEAIVLGFAVLMWMWTAASVHLVGAAARAGKHSLRTLWLGVAVAAGGCLLCALIWLILPDSFPGRLWTRELMEDAQRLALLAVILTGIAGVLRGQRRLATA